MLCVHGAASHPAAGTLRPRPLLQRVCGGERVQVLRPLPYLPHVLQASAGGRVGGRFRAHGGCARARACLRGMVLPANTVLSPLLTPPLVNPCIPPSRTLRRSCSCSCSAFTLMEIEDKPISVSLEPSRSCSSPSLSDTPR